jgi:hypothetical protein
MSMTKSEEDDKKCETNITYRLESAARGCSVLSFSKDGKLLACGCADLVLFPIRIYDVSSDNEPTCVSLTGTKMTSLVEILLELVSQIVSQHCSRLLQEPATML